MAVKGAFVDALLAVAVLTAAMSVLGFMVMRTTLDRLHYLAPVAAVSATAIAIALVIDEALNARGIKGLIVLAVVAFVGSVTVHAMARANQVREHGEWPPRDGRSHTGR